MVEPAALILGAVSISLAVGLNLYRNHQEEKRRRRDEEFFVRQIRANLYKMAQYFLEVEKATTHNEDYEVSNKSMMRSLKTFYLRNEQEMKDILYLSRLYLPLWRSLTPADKEEINKIFDTFSWLLYDYYSSSLPESICESAVLGSRSTLYRNKALVMDATDSILRKTEPRI